MDKKELIKALREQANVLENELREKEDYIAPNMTDIGCWVKVRNSRALPWSQQIYMLSDVVNSEYTDYPYRLANTSCKEAKIVTGPLRGMLMRHNGSPNKPKWLYNTDLVLAVSLPHGNHSVINAQHIKWEEVIHYQVLNLHYEK